MMLTLKQLSQQFEISEHLINEPIDYNKVIDSVTIIESLKVNLWLQGGEFLLTSSSTLTNDSETQYQLINNLIKFNAVGLAIKIQDKEFEISKNILKFAQKSNFPIFTIPATTTYLDIMDSINNILFVEREAEFFKKNLAKHLLTTRLDLISIPHLQSFDWLKSDSKTVVFQIGPDTNWLMTYEATTNSQAPNYWQGMRHLLFKLISSLNYLIQQTVIKDFLYVDDVNKISIILFFQQNIKQSDVETALKKISKQLSSIEHIKSEGRVIYYGLSKSVSLDNIMEANRQASFSHDINQFIDTGSNFIPYTCVEFYDIMTHLTDPKITNNLVTHLQPIIENTQLMDTLKSFFRNNEHLKKTSKDLFIHVNTLRYRLEKIRNLTDLDYKKTGDKFKLFLGIIHFKLNKTIK